MKITVNNSVATGLLEFISHANIPENELTNLYYALYNLNVIVWYDLEQDIVLIKMQGSIVSMLQFRKYILMSYPNILKE